MWLYHLNIILASIASVLYVVAIVFCFRVIVKTKRKKRELDKRLL